MRCATAAPIAALITILSTLVASSTALAGDPKSVDPTSLGAREYAGHCASCHGRDGKGNGPYTELLKIAVPDLTKLAKNNDGVFPLTRVYRVIDGRDEVKAHGPREMPIWGNKYNKAAKQYHIDYFGPFNAEAYVQTRVLALVSYLNEIQDRD